MGALFSAIVSFFTPWLCCPLLQRQAPLAENPPAAALGYAGTARTMSTIQEKIDELEAEIFRTQKVRGLRLSAFAALDDVVGPIVV